MVCLVCTWHCLHCDIPSALCPAVHYSSGVGIHSFPPQGQLLAADLQDQGTLEERWSSLAC